MSQADGKPSSHHHHHDEEEEEEEEEYEEEEEIEEENPRKRNKGRSRFNALRFLEDEAEVGAETESDTSDGNINEKGFLVVLSNPCTISLRHFHKHGHWKTIYSSNSKNR